MDKHYIFNIEYLTHTSFPEIAFGILCLVAAIYLCYKIKVMVKPCGTSAKVSPPANTKVEKADLFQMITGHWSDSIRSTYFHIYPWGNNYLMEEITVDGSKPVVIYGLYKDYENRNLFHTEGNKLLSFIYNEDEDRLLLADRSSMLERLNRK